MGGRSGWSQRKRDRVLQAECHGEAWRRVSDGESIAGIVEAVRGIAGDRGWVLVETAGVGVGVWAGRVSPLSQPTELLVAGILLQAAGASSKDDLARWVEVGRRRALEPPHTAS